MWRACERDLLAVCRLGDGPETVVLADEIFWWRWWWSA